MVATVFFLSSGAGKLFKSRESNTVPVLNQSWRITYLQS
jgi:hypothetical protein